MIDHTQMNQALQCLTQVKYIKMNKIEALEKQKVYLQEQLRKAGQEIKELKEIIQKANIK
jgi:hypothetical protein